MKKKVTLVTLNAWPNAIPLVSGYLKSSACQLPEITDYWEFEFYNNVAAMPMSEFLEDMINAQADVYAISCYIWNMGTVKRIIFDLLDANPSAQILLGGPQVANHAHKYLRPEYENTAVCNGEGEITFRHYLKALMAQPVDLNTVQGLSFYRNGVLVTTEKEQRIKHFDDIPSPFLSGLFDEEQYEFAFLETTRGCP